MGKTSDLFKSIRDTRRTFHARMGMIKDRNNKDLKEAEEVNMARIHRKTVQKKVLMTQITTIMWPLT